MELNSLLFILIFLPIFIASMYFIKNNNIRNNLILIFSLLFYICNDIDYFLLLLFIVAFTYLLALKVNHNKVLYGIYLLIIILNLVIFKYSHIFNLENLIMPVGISFYTFTSISYVSDVYYGKIEKEINFLNVATYLTFFPTITSGPILRYDRFKTYLTNKNINFDNISNGFRRFIIGLFKKVVIANNLAIGSNACFTGKTISMPLAWFGSLCFMLQLYYDFQGYSDMAIGIGKMIGFSIPENFKDPYTSTSVKEFWHRWHISLSMWFKDYVYIPLGGSRVPFIRWIINILVVWSLTGIWHGSTFNYLLWGLWNALFLILEKTIFDKIKIPNFFKWIGTMFVTMFGFTIFHTENLEYLIVYFLSMINKGERFSLLQIERLDVFYLWLYMLLAIIFTIPRIKKMFYSINSKAPIIYDFILIMLFAISIVFIINGSYVSFIYAGF